MTCCFTAQPERLASPALDPTKHVNYVLGMILGEDDFKQEFAYLSERDQWLARDLIGYGTVRGLGVRTEWDGANGPRIYVDGGVALTPRGQLVCVSAPQCAHINAWLEKHAAEVQEAAASPPVNPLSLYVVLCYRECPTDKVPIPGEPCRTEDQLVKPSRLRDDFVLELTLKPPVQREERALRDFCEWVRQIDMSDSSVTSIELDRFLDEIRHAAAPWYSPPASPPLGDFLSGSPPAWLHVHPADAGKYLRAAFHLWVTELRPKWIARWYGCAPDLKEPMPLEDCVLLAEIQVGLVFDSGTGMYKSKDNTLPDVSQTERPFIVHLRMLQEWLLCKREVGSDPGVSPTNHSALLNLGADDHPQYFNQVRGDLRYAQINHTHNLDDLGDVSAASPPNNQVLIRSGGQWVAGNPDHGALTGLGDDDHTQYLLVDGGRALTGDLSAGNFKITNLAQANADGQALPFGQPAKGDLKGNYPAPVVAQLQGWPVSNGTPNRHNVLTWNGAAWEPRSVARFPSLPFVTITRLDDKVFETWFNVDAPTNDEEIPGLKKDHVKIFMETETREFREEIRITKIERRRRNLFLLSLEKESELLRFTFDISRIKLASGLTVAEHASNRGLSLMGHDGGNTVTAFVRVTKNRR